MPSPPDRYLDLDAFVPRARPGFHRGARVKIDGVEYPVRQLSDITGQEELDLAALDRAVEESRTDHQVRRALFDRAFTMVRLLVPDLPERARLGLTYEKANAIAAEAWAYATEAVDPQSADTAIPEPAPEESSRPASASITGSIRAI